MISFNLDQFAYWNTSGQICTRVTEADRGELLIMISWLINFLSRNPLIIAISVFQLPPTSKSFSSNTSREVFTVTRSL